MYKGTTPTFTLTLPETVDLSTASNVYVTFKKNDVILTKTGEDLSIDRNTVSVFLTQEETLAFPDGQIRLQINWTYVEGNTMKRACSEVANVYFQQNLKPEVLE